MPNNRYTETSQNLLHPVIQSHNTLGYISNPHPGTIMSNYLTLLFALHMAIKGAVVATQGSPDAHPNWDQAYANLPKSVRRQAENRWGHYNITKTDRDGNPLPTLQTFLRVQQTNNEQTVAKPPAQPNDYDHLDIITAVQALNAAASLHSHTLDQINQGARP